MVREQRFLALCSVLLLGGCSLSAGGTNVAQSGSQEPVREGDGADANADAGESPGEDAALPVREDAGPGEPALPGEPDAGPPDAGLVADALRLNELQLKGSHKSYHVAGALALPPRNFSHAPLTEQLEQQGVRALSLDVHQRGNQLAVYDSDIIDRGSTCDTLASCLEEVSSWSSSHPRHLPLVIWLEAKDRPGNEDAFDTVIAGAFPATQLILPRDVQGQHASLRAALTREGWPTVAALRGRIMFVLAGDEPLLRAYSHDFQDLDGRAMFVSASAAQASAPWAVVQRIEDPLDETGLRTAVSAGLLVASLLCRPGDDDATCEARRDAAFANGPHLLFDTYPAPVDSRSYWLDMTAFGEARCHPYEAPSGCAAALLTDSRP